MRTPDDAMGLVRARLCDELDRVAAALPRLRPAAFVRELGELQRVALEYGLLPVAEIARALAATVAGDHRSPLVAHYLAAMRDAAGCTRADPAASGAYLASVGVRLVA